MHIFFTDQPDSVLSRTDRHNTVDEVFPPDSHPDSQHHDSYGSSGSQHVRSRPGGHLVLTGNDIFCIFLMLYSRFYENIF